MRYYIKQKVFSLKDRFTIYNFDQEELFKVEGEMFSFKNKLNLMKLDGEIILYAEKKIFSFLPEYSIYTTSGEVQAVIKQKFSLKPKYEVYEGGNNITVDGNFFGHSFQVYKNGQLAAAITHKLFTFGDSYEIDILDVDSDLLYMFIVIVIDQVAQAAANRSRSNA
jgi:uncharacterized protein YxjI